MRHASLALGKRYSILNGLNSNAYEYTVYTHRAVLPVSRELAVLRETLDQALGIKHNESAATQ